MKNKRILKSKKDVEKYITKNIPVIFNARFINGNIILENGISFSILIHQ